MFKKLLGILFLILIFELLTIFSDIGYTANVRDILVEGKDDYGNSKVLVSCTITYNPLLWLFSWLKGDGQFSGDYRFICMAIWYPIIGDGLYLRSRNPTHTEIKEQAISTLVMQQFNTSILFNFILLLMIGLLNIHDLYLCIFGGSLGFPVAGFLGALIAFFAVLSIVIFVKLRLWKEGLFARLWKFFLEEDSYPYETPRT